MPQPSRHTTFSTESLSALFDALGLSKFGDDEEEAHCINLTYARSRCDSTKRRSVTAKRALARSCDSNDYARPSSSICNLEKFDDYAIVEEEDASPIVDFSDLDQNYLSDICPDLDFESDSDCEFNTLPSRPGSSLDGFEYLPSILTPMSPHPPTSFSMHSGISSQTSSLQSSPSSPHFPQQQQTHHHSNHHDTAPGASMISIKAALNATILMLRVPATISLPELKKRVHDKFLKQEGVRLSRDFSVVHVQPPVGYDARPSNGIMMEQRWGLSSTDEKISRQAIPFSDRTEMRVVDADLDWRRIVKVQCRRNDGSKVTLRIVDTPSY